MEGYRTVGKRAQAEMVVRKSRFIGCASPAADEQQATQILAEIREKHPQASHNCYAYVLDDSTMKSSDDGEPSGTAGRPILEVLRRQQLEKVLVVVTRYFGGTLLGAGGLVRAYSQVAVSAVEAAGTGQIIPCRMLEIETDYTNYGRLEQYLRQHDIAIEESQFEERVRVVIGISTDSLAETEARLLDLLQGRAKLKQGRDFPRFVKGR
jgi:uncharacterized YigZ family protein